MDLWLRRKLWLVNVVVVAGCAIFLARTLSQGFETRYLLPNDALASLTALPTTRPPHEQLSDRPVATPEPEPVAAPAVPPAPAPEPVAAPEPAPPPAPIVVAPPPLTTLPLSLVATSVVDPARYSSAIVADSSQRSSNYWPGDLLPGAGPIVAIAPRYVDFVNRVAGRTERLDLVASADRPPAAEQISDAALKSRAPATGKTELDAQMDKSIKQVDATHYKVDRSFVDNMLANPAVLMNTLRARPVPATGGQPGGLRLSGVKPGSAAARIGLLNGDTITSINGNDLSGGDYDRMLEMYTKLKSARSLSVQVSRKGQPVALEYAIQ